MPERERAIRRNYFENRKKKNAARAMGFAIKSFQQFDSTKITKSFPIVLSFFYGAYVDFSLYI